MKKLGFRHAPIEAYHKSPSGERFLLTAAAELTEPCNEDGVGTGLDIEKFEAHADSGFDDADHGESFDGFAFAFESDAGAGSHG